VLLEQFMDAEALRAVMADHHEAGLEPVDVAVMDYAEKIVDDATSVTEMDVERLREHGLSDSDILDVAAAAAARCFFSKLLDALGVQADATFRELEPELSAALTVGRPVAG
jgi:alkylhydroperoxidase family enzyme